MAIGLAVWSGCAESGPRVNVTPHTFLSTGEHRLVADLFTPRQSNGMGIVLLHGSLIDGRNHFFYQDLSHRLAARGYTILNVDLRGYGDSDSPKDPTRLEDYDFIGDAHQSMDYAVSMGNGLRWLLAGHTKGGALALYAGIDHPDVAGVISMSPSRRMRERFFDNPDPRHLEYLQRRRSSDMQLDTLIPLNLLESMTLAFDLERSRNTNIPRPFLLIEGSLEPDGDLQYTVDWVATVSGPVTHRVIPNTDHYYGVSVIDMNGTRAWRVTNFRAFRELMDTIDEWITQTFATR